MMATSMVKDIETSASPIHGQPDSPAIYGTFEPVPTAQTLGKLLTLAVKSAKLPLSKYDEEISRIEESAARGLPDDPTTDMEPSWERSWKKFKFRFMMNNSKNSLGRMMISLGSVGGKSAVSVSCGWKARRELTRVLLASVLFRRDHKGELPGSLSHLVPNYLSRVPIDPFDGKSMRFNAQTKVTYCIGQDLIDNGGDISTKAFIPKDIGISLR